MSYCERGGHCVLGLDHAGSCRDYPNERDCAHGRQRGKCSDCDVVELERRAEKAEAINKRLVGVLEELVDLTTRSSAWKTARAMLRARARALAEAKK